MKVLIVGSSHVAAMEHSYVVYLTEMGVANHLFPAQNIFYDYYHSSIFNKIRFRLGISGILVSINRQLIEVANNYKPDIVLFFKGMEIYPETLRRLKEMGTRLVNYNPDSPFLFSGFGSGNKNVSQSIQLFDLYLTYDKQVLNQLKEKGTQAGLIPFGFEISEEQVKQYARQEEVLRICFLGNPDKTRADFINQLADAGLPVDVYGHHWNRHRLNKNIRAFAAVYEEEYWKVLRRYRVQLNLMRPHNLQSHNMRSIEVPAVGGIGLFPYTPDHSRFFEHGKEIFLYNSLQDCMDQAKMILALGKENADQIRMQARKRSEKSGYSYKDRTVKLVEYLRTII